MQDDAIPHERMPLLREPKPLCEWIPTFWVDGFFFTATLLRYTLAKTFLRRRLVFECKPRSQDYKCPLLREPMPLCEWIPTFARVDGWMDFWEDKRCGFFFYRALPQVVPPRFHSHKIWELLYSNIDVPGAQVCPCRPTVLRESYVHAPHFFKNRLSLIS